MSAIRQDSKVRPRFSFMDYNNALYQGYTLNLVRHGPGVLLQDSLRFIVSDWNLGEITGDTVIFQSHSKYFYGAWKSSLPHGFNVYRSGDTVLFANFVEGRIAGEYLIVFQSQDLLLTVRSQTPESKSEIIGQKEGVSQSAIKAATEQIHFDKAVPDYYFSLRKFLERNFKKEPTLSPQFQGLVDYRVFVTDRSIDFNYLGVKPDTRSEVKVGLGLKFDDDYFVNCVGKVELAGELENGNLNLIGMGAKFNHNQIVEIGDFEFQDTVKYKSTEALPRDALRIFREKHLASMDYINDYFNSESVSQVFRQIDKILKEQIIPQIAQEKLELSRNYHPEDFNDSLEYRPTAPTNDGERLRKIRDQLYRSIGRPGADIKPIPVPITKDIKYPHLQQTKKRSRLDTEDIYKPLPEPTGRFKSKPIDEVSNNIKINRYQFMEENRLNDYLPPSCPPPLPSASKYEDVRERRERLIREYKDLGTPSVVTPNPYVSSTPPRRGYNHPSPAVNPYDSPGRHLNVDTDRNSEAGRPLGSSRKVFPVLHEKPIITVTPNQSLKPQPSTVSFARAPEPVISKYGQEDSAAKDKRLGGTAASPGGYTLDRSPNNRRRYSYLENIEPS